MEIALSLVGTFTPIAYALAVACYVLLFLRADDWARRGATRLLILALVIHAAELLLRGLVHGRLPLGNAFESLSAIAFSVAVVYLYIEIRQQNPMTGVFVLPLVFVGEAVASALASNTGPTPDILRSMLFGFHAGAAMLGYCGFAVATIYGILFLILYHELKSRRFSIVYNRLPPLEILARMNIRALTIGFLFLSIAIVLGAVWASRVQSASLADPKVLLTIVAWGIFALSLLAHFVLRWGGPRVIYITVAGFVLLVSSSVAVNLVGSSFHVFQ